MATSNKPPIIKLDKTDDQVKARAESMIKSVYYRILYEFIRLKATNKQFFESIHNNQTKPSVTDVLLTVMPPGITAAELYKIADRYSQPDGIDWLFRHQVVASPGLFSSPSFSPKLLVASFATQQEFKDLLQKLPAPLYLFPGELESMVAPEPVPVAPGKQEQSVVAAPKPQPTPVKQEPVQLSEMEKIRREFDEYKANAEARQALMLKTSKASLLIIKKMASLLSEEDKKVVLEDDKEMDTLTDLLASLDVSNKQQVTQFEVDVAAKVSKPIAVAATPKKELLVSPENIDKHIEELTNGIKQVNISSSVVKSSKGTSPGPLQQQQLKEAQSVVANAVAVDEVQQIINPIKAQINGGGVAATPVKVEPLSPTLLLKPVTNMEDLLEKTKHVIAPADNINRLADSGVKIPPPLPPRDHPPFVPPPPPLPTSIVKEEPTPLVKEEPLVAEEPTPIVKKEKIQQQSLIKKEPATVQDLILQTKIRQSESPPDKEEQEEQSAKAFVSSFLSDSTTISSLIPRLDPVAFVSEKRRRFYEFLDAKIDVIDNLIITRTRAAIAADIFDRTDWTTGTKEKSFAAQYVPTSTSVQADIDRVTLFDVNQPNRNYAGILVAFDTNTDQPNLNLYKGTTGGKYKSKLLIYLYGNETPFGDSVGDAIIKYAVRQLARTTLAALLVGRDSLLQLIKQAIGGSANEEGLEIYFMNILFYKIYRHVKQLYTIVDVDSTGKISLKGLSEKYLAYNALYKGDDVDESHPELGKFVRESAQERKPLLIFRDKATKTKAKLTSMITTTFQDQLEASLAAIYKNKTKETTDEQLAKIQSVLYGVVTRKYDTLFENLLQFKDEWNNNKTAADFDKTEIKTEFDQSKRLLESRKREQASMDALVEEINLTEQYLRELAEKGSRAQVKDVPDLFRSPAKGPFPIVAVDIDLPVIPIPVIITQLPQFECVMCQQPAKFQCSGCAREHYCSAGCQQLHWMASHSRECVLD